jgi:hypothetical protein
MGPLRLAARRADVDPRRGDTVLRAPLVAAGLRRLSLRDGHERAEYSPGPAGSIRNVRGIVAPRLAADEVITAAVRIRLSEPALLPDLLAFLRASGCIAYYVPGTEEVEALTPHLFGAEERAEIGRLLARWRDGHPSTETLVLADRSS